MNGDLERLVYNRVMDMETMNFYMQLANDIVEFLAVYVFLPIGTILATLIVYGIYKKIVRKE
jgi:hypothetical protein